MGLHERVSKLEAGNPAPECQTCIKPRVILYSEPKPPEICPSCGGRWSTITVVSEKCRQGTMAILAGEMPGKRTIDMDSDRGQEVLASLVDCGAVRLADQAEPHQDAQATFQAPSDIIPKAEPVPGMKCTKPEPLPKVSQPHPQDRRDDTPPSPWEKQF